MITITISTNNDAFSFPNYGDEVSRILKDLSEKARCLSHAPSKSALGMQDAIHFLIRDSNGNRVGEMTIQ